MYIKYILTFVDGIKITAEVVTNKNDQLVNFKTLK